MERHKIPIAPLPFAPSPSPALPIDAMQITLLLREVVYYQKKVQTSQDGMGRSVFEISCSQTGGLYVLYR